MIFDSPDQPASLPVDGISLVAPAPNSNKATFARNVLMNVGRLFISMAVGFILPSFLIHRLPVTTYSAWVLILQLSAYVNYLDFGIQNGISKYVAEYDARGDTAGSSMRASAGLVLLLMVSVVGVLLTAILAWRVPHLFHEMPSSLYRDVRISLLFVGISASFGLLSSIFGSIFTGLQRFSVPTIVSLVNRILYVAVVIGAVFLHGSLAAMGMLVAVVNVATGIVHFVAWRKLAGHVRLSLINLDYGVVRQMLSYCSVLAIWTVGMLCVTGLDVTIVGRYDFAQTGFYSIAATPTNFLIAIIGSAMAPLLPTTSALSVHRSPSQMGQILAKTTRYVSVLLVISALPLLVGGYWVLRIWVGSVYASQIVGYLRILVIANVIRNTCSPYASMLVATNSQKVAIAGASAEAVVNLGGSIYLVRHIGAMGVAYGTLLGSFVSIGMHFALSMHYTYTKFSISRARLFLTSIVRPLSIGIPSLLLFARWWSDSAPAFGASLWVAWAVSTLLLAWFAALDSDERIGLQRLLYAKLKFRQPTANPIR